MEGGLHGGRGRIRARDHGHAGAEFLLLYHTIFFGYLVLFLLFFFQQLGGSDLYVYEGIFGCPGARLLEEFTNDYDYYDQGSQAEGESESEAGDGDRYGSEAEAEGETEYEAEAEAVSEADSESEAEAVGENEYGSEPETESEAESEVEPPDDPSAGRLRIRTRSNTLSVLLYSSDAATVGARGFHIRVSVPGKEKKSFIFSSDKNMQ